MNKIPIATGIVGITIIVCSIIRWFFLWYDPSQMIVGVVIGIIILGFAYIYDWMKEKDKEFRKLNKRMDDFTKWLGKGEMK